MTTPDEAAREQKAAAVKDIADAIFIATGRLMGPELRYMERLYDRAHEDGRESGIAQAGIAVGQSLTPSEPYKHAKPAKHQIVSLPGSVRDVTGDPLPGYGKVPSVPAESYPLTALCSECHEPVRRETTGSPWEHTR